MADATILPRPYYRGDQAAGITGPDLVKECTFAEHICHARGKRTQFTSISLDKGKIRDFGDVVYELIRGKVDDEGHVTVEHAELIESLRRSVNEESKAEKARAILALRRAGQRKEGLVDWRFDLSGVEAKDRINWATGRVQAFFKRA